jgi:hypothetical protein
MISGPWVKGLVITEKLLNSFFGSFSPAKIKRKTANKERNLI